MPTLKAEQLQHLTEFVSISEKWFRRMDQLELTPLEFRFIVDVKACAGAAREYVKGQQFSDHQLLSATVMCATFCMHCMTHDSQFYDHYFNVADEFLPNYSAAIQVEGVNKLTIAMRDDNIAIRARNGDIDDE